MTHSRIPVSHPLVAEISNLDPTKIPWVPYALKIIGAIDERDEYNHTDLMEMSGGDQLEVQTAAMVLSSWQNPILDMFFYTIHEGERTQVPAATVSALMRNEDVSHPVTGQPFEDAAEKCYITYKLRDGL